MYPSNPNNIISSSIRPFPNINDSKLEEDHSPSSFFHFPSPFYEEDGVFLQYLHDHLLQPQPPFADDHVSVLPESIVIELANTKTRDQLTVINQMEKEVPIRKRSSKKDRHSKINTANGPRDRRMRLSLDVARRFFDLQDMLGFDKASKTVEWLMTKSKTAIKEVSGGINGGGSNSVSSPSEEVVSGIEESSRKAKAKPDYNTKEKKMRVFRKTGFRPLGKEGREKARERARERTREKRRLNTGGKLNSSLEQETGNHCDSNQLGSSSSFVEKNCDESIQNHNADAGRDVQVRVEEARSQERQFAGSREEIVADSLAISSNWIPTSFFSYQQNNGIHHENQLADFQLYDKTWEAYNIMNLC